MNAKLIRLSIRTGFAVESAGAIVHTEYSESGSWHWLEHVAEAKSQPRGIVGPVRNDPDSTASPRTPPHSKPEQPPVQAFSGLGGIGGDKTSRTDALTVLTIDQPGAPSSPFDGPGGIGGKDTTRSDSLATMA